MGAALKLDGGDDPLAQKRRARELALGARPAPTFESFSPEHCETLLGVCRGVFDRMEGLLSFADTRRDTARQAGVETIAVEISGILQGGRLERVLDALETAAVRESSAQISIEGLHLLRRAERLLAEAAQNVRRYADRQASEFRTAEESGRRDAELGAARIALDQKKLELLREEHKLREHDLGRALEERRAALASIQEAVPDHAAPQYAPEPLEPSQVLSATYPAQVPENDLPLWPFILFGVLGFATAIAAIAWPQRR